MSEARAASDTKTVHMRTSNPTQSRCLEAESLRRTMTNTEAGPAGGGNPAKQPWPWSNARMLTAWCWAASKSLVIKWGRLCHHGERDHFSSP